MKDAKKTKKTVVRRQKKKEPTAYKTSKVATRPIRPDQAEEPFSDVRVSVVGVDGKTAGKISLPGFLFAAKIHPQLVAQAVRVYLANQRAGSASTKTRGEVQGSTRKIYRQKGTGRARHGAIRAPVFVGGGIVFGPKPRDYSLNMPKKMKRRAFASALTSKRIAGDVIIVDGLEALTPKTKVMAQALQSIGAVGKSLIVTAKDAQSLMRATRNIKAVNLLPANNLHTYAVLRSAKLVITKNAISILKETFKKPY